MQSRLQITYKKVGHIMLGFPCDVSNIFIRGVSEGRLKIKKHIVLDCAGVLCYTEFVKNVFINGGF